MSAASDWAALVGSLVAGALAIFQLLLASGRPLGRAAYGGKFSVLPTRLRIASGASACLFVVALFIVLARVGHVGDVGHSTFVLVGAWCFVVLFALSTLANLASPSRWEQRCMAPVAFVLTSCFVVVALR